MVPVDVRRQQHVSFTQIDQYPRCPLKYRLRRGPPGARLRARGARLRLGDPRGGGVLLPRRRRGERPSVADVQGYFEALWKLESEHRPLRFGEKETKESLLDLATRMLAVLCAEFDPRTEVVAVEQPFAVPLIDQETGEVLERDLVGTLDLLERDAEGRLVVVDLKTSARKYTSLEVEAALQLSVYSYATGFLGYADPDQVRLRFDVLTKTKQPELHRYWTTRDRAANVRLFRMAAEVLSAIEAGAFHPVVGGQCKECPFRSKCRAWK